MSLSRAERHDQNTANESVPFPLPGVVAGMPDDCTPRTINNPEMFALTGISNRYVAAFRGHEKIKVPTVESGSTNTFSVLWAVSRADLKRQPQISIHFLDMQSYISTFLIARSWAGDPDHYAELRLPHLELS